MSVSPTSFILMFAYMRSVLASSLDLAASLGNESFSMQYLAIVLFIQRFCWPKCGIVNADTMIQTGLKQPVQDLYRSYPLG